jgi:hypothetical protein
VRVLGDGLYRDATDLEQRRALDYRAGAAEEGGVPEVIAVLDQAVEKAAFIRHAPEGVEIAFERIGREEVVGVWTSAHFGSSRNSPMVICRNERVGMWSQSKIAM